MVGKNPEKPTKTNFVLKSTTSTRQSARKKNGGAGAGQNSPQSESQGLIDESQLDSQVIPNEIEGAVDLSQSSAIPLDSQDVDADGDINMIAAAIPVDNARASLDQIPGRTNEYAADIMAAVSTLSTAVESIGQRVDQAHRDMEQAQRSIDEMRSSMTQAIAGLEASSRQLLQQADVKTASSIQEIQRHVSDSKSSAEGMLQSISDAVAAVQASVSGLSAENSVIFMDQAGPSSEVGAPRAHCSSQMANMEPPTEYCNVTFNDEIHYLHLTHAEHTMITAATTLREFIRRILCKHYTIPDLQRFTLKGKGFKKEIRPCLPGWMVELIIKAANIWRPFPAIPADERADGPMHTAKRIHDQHISGKVRRLISDILQYYRETRDPQGNMRRRQRNPPGSPDDLAEGGGEMDKNRRSTKEMIPRSTKEMIPRSTKEMNHPTERFHRIPPTQLCFIKAINIMLAVLLFEC